MASDIKIEVIENILQTTSEENVVEIHTETSVVEVHNADGLNGITPHIGDNGNWWIGTIDTGVHAQGAKGEQGENGLTPYIGENGNWFVGDVDLGVKAQGEQGLQGEQGIQGEKGADGKDGVNGKDGKSAYQQAVEGGYTGTEQEFNCSLSLLADVAEGKKQIADSINERGGNANPNSAFTQLAQDIEDIPNFPTTGFEYISEIYRPRTLMEAYNSRYYLKSIVNNTIEEINGNYTFDYCTFLVSVQLLNLTTISGTHTLGNCTSLVSVQLPNLTTISGPRTFTSCTSLVSVQLPNLTTISGPHTFTSCTSLVSVQLPNLTTISGIQTFSTCTSLLSVQLPNLTTISGSQTFNSCSSLQSVQFGSLILCVDPFFNSKPNLRNITIKDTNINLPFQQWTATNVIAEGQSGIDELNANLYNNLLTKLYDHSEDGEERTLRLGWYNYVSEENKLYAKNKGWNITT